MNDEKFKQHIKEIYPQEAVGFLLNTGEIEIVENIHENPVDSFLVDKEVFLKYSSSLEAILHSHTFCKDSGQDPRIPSKADMALAENTRKPCAIYHTDGENCSKPLWFNNSKKYLKDYCGRNYIANVKDCYTLVCDYYIKEYNYRLPLVPRESCWQESEPSLFLMLEQKTKLKKIVTKDLCIGDIVVFSIASNKPNHVGIFIGGTLFLHHLSKRKSCTDSLVRWSRQYKYAYRLEQ